MHSRLDGLMNLIRDACTLATEQKHVVGLEREMIERLRTPGCEQHDAMTRSCI